MTSSHKSDAVPGHRILFLEAARGIAALLVVAHHALTDAYSWYRDFHETIDLGRIGVVTFFVVSGYVIPLSLGKQSQRTFWVRRFFRLYPIYWVALAVYVAVAWPNLGSPSPSVWLLNIAMLHGIIGALSILPPAWTLSIELIYYVQSSLSKAAHSLTRGVHFGWCWLALYFLLCGAARATDKDLPVTLPLLLFVASLGHSLHLRDSEGSRLWVWFVAAAVVVIPAGTYLRGDDPQWPPLTYSLSTLVGIGLFFAVYAARSMRTPAVLVWLGGISYALYLFHMAAMRFSNHTLELTGLAHVGVGVTASLVVSWVAHRYLELPFIAVGRRLTQRPVAQPEPV